MLKVLLGIMFIAIQIHGEKIYVKFEDYNNYTVAKVKLIENEMIMLNFTISYCVNETFEVGHLYSFGCFMDDVKVGKIVNQSNIILPPCKQWNESFDFEMNLNALRLGGSDILCTIRQHNETGDKSLFYEVVVSELIVTRVQTVAELIFRIFVIIFIVFLTFVMGCGLDRYAVFGYLKKPLSPAIGMLSQYLFMPLVSVAIAKITQIEDEFGFGLLTIGCSPGGGASNIWTTLFDGDLNLSMTMTFLSSCAALFMMPFWLFVLGRIFINTEEVKIPYVDIGLNLLQVVLPMGAGILFRYKCEAKAKLLADKVKFGGLLFIIFILTYGTYCNLYIYKLIADYWYLLPVGASLPWFGFIFGYVISVVSKRNKQQCIAISLETGFQNIGIAILILKFSIPQPGGDLGSVIPIVVALFTPLPLYIMFIAILIKRRCRNKKSKASKEEEKEDDENNDENNDENKIQETRLIESSNVN